MQPTKTLQEAIEARYVVRSGKNHKISGQYFEWCSKHDKPYVVVVLRGQWASVELDLIGVSYRLNTLGMNAARALLDEVTPANVKRRRLCRAGGTWSHSPKVPVEKAAALAWALALVGDNLDYRVSVPPRVL